MEYALLMYEGAEDFALREDPERAEAYWASWAAYSAAIAEAGIMRGGAGLLPPAVATTVRGGSLTVQDGPFADSKEHLGGFFVVDVPDLDQALAWAAKAPVSSTGSVEVRPTLASPS